jgi:hypothetical protein
MLVIKVQFIDHRLYYALGIVRIVNGKIAGVAQAGTFCPQYPGKYTVKSSDI